MSKIVAALLMAAALANPQARASANVTSTPAKPVSTKHAADIDIAGPFDTFEEADDYAYYLEDEYGYDTEIVFHEGLFYVVYA